MRKSFKSVGMNFLAVFIATTAMVSARDITIYDNQTGSGWYAGATDLQTRLVPQGYNGLATSANPNDPGRNQAIREDQETEPGTVATQMWDMEAIVLDNSGTKLSFVGGYRWDVGSLSSSVTTNPNDPGAFYPGDIFISIDGQPNPTAAGTAFAQITNPGFEYVIAFDGYERGVGAANAQGVAVNGVNGTGTYKIYKLGANDKVVAVNNIANSNAYRYLPGYGQEVVIPNAVFRTAQQTGALTDAQATAFVNNGTPLAEQRSLLGDVGNVASHYVLTVDITYLLNEFGQGNTLGAHFTMGCGNDEIIGWLPTSPQTAPDGGSSLALVGLSMMGLHILRRRKA